MAWFKIDDGFFSHPKTMAASFESIGLWTIAGSWAAKHKTYGVVPDVVVTELFGASDRVVEQLIEARLWERTPGGYKFVNWRKWQDGDYRKNIPLTVRRAVMSRDGGRCVFCGSLEALSLDHIVRYRDDGPDTAQNLRVLCMPCNQERG